MKGYQLLLLALAFLTASSLALEVTMSKALIVEQSVASAKPAIVKGDFFTNWINNNWFFTMRIMYDLFCFGVAMTYIFWYNDGGANFYKCWNSVPRYIQYL